MAYNYLLGEFEQGPKKTKTHSLMTDEGGTGKAFLEDVDKELTKVSEKHRQFSDEGTYVDRGGAGLLEKGKEALQTVREKAGDVKQDINEKADAAKGQLTNVREEMQAGTEQVLSDLNLPKFNTDKGKEFLKQYGAQGVEKYKEAVGIIQGMSDIALPDDIMERFATQLAARPDLSNISEEEKASIAKQIEDTHADAEKMTVALDNTDPNTEEGRNLWERVSNAMGVPFEYLKESWDEFDKVAGGVPNGVAGLVGDGFATARDGAVWLNSKVDFLTMLAAGAAAGQQSGNLGIAVAQGLASGIQARKQQEKERLSALEEQRRYAVEQNRENYKALTQRRTQEQNKQKNLLERQDLSANDLKRAAESAKQLGASLPDVESAMVTLKAAGHPITIENMKKVLSGMPLEKKGIPGFREYTSGGLL